MSTTPEGDSGPVGHWTADDIPDLSGRTAVVTGANSGLGYHTTRELARHGAKVIMAVRSDARGRSALEALRAEQPDADLELRYLDLADLDTVRPFAGGVPKLDLLINNAGIMMPPRTLSKQGYELQFAANHLGHFALTALLLDRMTGSQDARVVTVSSNLHKRGRIHFDDLHGEHNYSRTGYYAQSKLANVVFAIELNRRLRAAGLPVRSVLAHPGYAATNLQSTGPTGVGKLVMKVSNRLFAQDAAMGALPQLYAATHPDVEGGQFLGPDGRGESKGYPTQVEPLDAARDRELAKRLWDVSEELSGIPFPLAP
jgi:NAD(P)-dependent dehydrogenase (short-subunit alcohol dehydrogenase family)